MAVRDAVGKISVSSSAAVGRPSLVDGAEQAVRDWLVPGSFREGDRLPPEQELASMLGVSRGTLRSALSRLEDNGEIVRRQGSGTFVGRIAPSMGIDGRLPRVEDYAYRSHHGPPIIVHVDVADCVPGPKLVAGLELAPGEVATLVHRVMAIAGRRTMLCSDAFAPGLVGAKADGLRERLSAGTTMHEVLHSIGARVAFSRTSITPQLVEPGTPLGTTLELEETTACLRVDEVVFDEGGRPLLASTDVIAPGSLQIEVLQSVGAPTPGPVEH